MRANKGYSMAKTKRIEQVAGEIQMILGTLIQHELKDPRMGFTTVMGVSISPDLYVAHINVSVMGDAETRKATMSTLERAKGFLRRELGHQLRLRQVPELHFHLDTTLDTREYMDNLIRDIEQERTENPPIITDDEE